MSKGEKAARDDFHTQTGETRGIWQHNLQKKVNKGKYLEVSFKIQYMQCLQIGYHSPIHVISAEK